MRRIRPRRATLAGYTTSFPLTENPISESGNWHHTAVDLTNVRTQTISGVHLATGTQTGSGSFDDSNTYLSGFTPDHEIEATIWKAAGITSTPIQEVEVLLRWSDDNASFDPGGGFGNTTVHGYEINMNQDGGYLNIGQYKGPMLAFANSSPASQLGRAPQTGDKMKARIVTSGANAIITVYLNGVLVTLNTGNSLTITSPWTTGNPGIGFYLDAPDSVKFAFSSVTAGNV